ncbi:maltokinase N-terminal cap-like domain-containing protein [Microbacterium hominis]|uniref:maltokinase N-terminal cap-like domain-containing protein n=1 Tax=Microbacterium hominis TaxID=162426 RepID=UPI000B02CE99|nr:hypothetical protein [Microbacterium hominis]
MQTTLRHLAAWMPQQRWYTPTGGEPRLRVLAERRLSSSAPDVDVQLLIVGDGDDADAIVYQVPLVWRPRTGEPGPSHTVGVDDDRLLVDGPHDPAFTAALLVELGRPDLAGPASVLTGEQSNTSVIFRPSHAAPVICKVFRRLHPGINPDIELQSALAAAGSAHVPPVIGHLDGEWTSTAPGEPAVRGSLAFAQEFLPDVEDAWRVALAAAAVSADFSAEAQSLGRATADVHRDLAHLFPTPPADDDARPSIVRGGDAARSRSRRCPRSARSTMRSRASTRAPRPRPGRTCNACTATTTSARSCTPPPAAGCSSTSRASRCARSPNGAPPTWR